jgi:DNA-binding NarL/FixJ family response regulator
LKGGTLFISRATSIFSWLKSAFDDCGFRDVTVSSLDRDALAFQLNELNPKNVFINSEFYSGVTPYMVGELLVRFPELKISVVNFGNFPDSLAVRFIFHGAKSYLDFNDGSGEFRKGLKMIQSGQDYYSPGVERYIHVFDEKPNLAREATNREWQVLFLACNGFKDDQIVANLAICRRTVDTHIKNLYKLFDVSKRENLVRKAVCLGWVQKEHLCFHGTDISIPHHPSRKRAKTNKKASKRQSLNEVTPA